PEQILGADRRAATKTGRDRQDAKKWIRQVAVQVGVVAEPDRVVGQAPAVQVIAALDIDLVVAGEGSLHQYAVRQFLLESEGVLVGARKLVPRRIEADAVSDAGEQPQTRAEWLGKPIRERVHQRVGTCETCRGSETVKRGRVRRCQAESGGYAKLLRCV